MIKRVYARISIVFIILSLVCIILCGILGNLPVVYPIVFASLGVVFLGVFTVLRIVMLKCPSCSKTLASPQWSKGRTFYCSYCGKPFEYDK